VRSIAVLAYTFPWVARAIGFHSIGGIATVPEVAWVVLVPELCHANPPPSSKLHRVRRSFHQLVDCPCFLLLAHILLFYPSVFNELPRKFAAEFLKCGHAVGLAKETLGEKCVHLRNGKQKFDHTQFPSC
jgi:hypothetical protein